MVFDPAARATWVREYLASGQTQAEFCASHRDRGGPSERTLRAWLAAETVRQPDRQQVRSVLVDTIERLTDFLRMLDAMPAAVGSLHPEQQHELAATGAAPRPAVAAAEPTSPAAAAVAEPAPILAQEGSTPSPRSAAPDLPRRGGFFADWE